MTNVDSVTIEAGNESSDTQNSEGNMEELLNLAIAESATAHTAMMLEITANGESAHSVVRHGGAQKFLREDPIEAAATETILDFRKTP